MGALHRNVADLREGIRMVAATDTSTFFPYGSQWLRADFHLHTRADREFSYTGEDSYYISSYVDALQNAKIRVGIITNHNTFDLSEFRLLRRTARKKGIFLLPGVELSVKDGSNGIHTLVTFGSEWIDSQENTNYIQSFLSVTFSGQSNFENENARSNHDLIETLRELDKFNRDYFLMFAHVEAQNGLWGGGWPAGVFRNSARNILSNNGALPSRKSAPVKSGIRSRAGFRTGTPPRWKGPTAKVSSKLARENPAM